MRPAILSRVTRHSVPLTNEVQPSLPSVPEAVKQPTVRSVNVQSHKRRTCRICGNSNLGLFLSLGSQPLANAFLSSREDLAAEARYPLDVYVCNTCSLVQLLDVVDPGTLFSHYLYLTGTSETMERHHAAYAGTIVRTLALEHDDLVVEVGSNDGSLLRHFQTRNLRVLGIEPASNVAELANKRGIQTLSRFFSLSVAAEVQRAHGEAKAVLANNVLAHVDDVQGFVGECMHLLHPAGLLVVEVPYLRRLIEKLVYDTIYHEHLCYFSVTALARLCRQLDLSIVRVDEVPVHGGSLRLQIGRQEHHGTHGRQVLELLETEQAEGLSSQRTLDGFANRVAANRRDIRQLLHDLVAQGKTVAGYGAPAKATTLLNYCGIGTGELPYLVDKNPWKVGRYQPGTGIPVLAVETLLEREPDYVLILPWNIHSEVVEQQRTYAQRGGRFIVPLPKPRVL